MLDFPLLWIGFFVLILCGLILCWRAYEWRLGVLLSGLVVVLYHYWGGYQDFVHVKAYREISTRLEQLVQNKDLNVGQVLDLLNTLKPKVENSHKGLARLGGLYSELGQYSEGAALLEKAILLSPKTPEYILQWAYHQSFLHQGKLPDEARKRLEELLEDPEAKPAAMNMLAMDDYFKEDYNAAIQHWSYVLENDDALTPERRTVLENALANAKAKITELSMERKT